MIANDGNNNYPLIRNICQQYSPVDSSLLCWESNDSEEALRNGFFAFEVR